MVDLRKDTLDDEDYRPFDAGWDARLLGHPMSDNPYATTNWKHYEWDKGWGAADKAAEEEPAIK